MSTSRRRVDVFEHHRATNLHNKTQTEKLTAIETLQTASNTKLDTIATNTANIKVEAESIDLNVDTLEALQTTGNNTLSSIDNKIILPSALDNGRLKVLLDANLADTNSKIDAMRGSNSLTDLATKLNAGLPSALDTDKLKVKDSHLTDGTAIVKAMGSEDGSTGGTQRQIHLDGNGNVLASLVSSVNVIPANSVNSHITDDPANSVAVGLTGRTTIGTATTQTHLLCNSDGELNVKNSTKKTNGSEVSYVSGQSISGSGTFEGSAIAIDPNTSAIFAEHNFSHTGIKYEILGSIDGSNFFSTGVEFNSGGMTPATLTGLETILGTSTSVNSFPPHIKFKFSNSDSSAQTATLSYVIQSS